VPELDRHDLRALLGDGRYQFLYQTPATPPHPADFMDQR
jgi:hypothetical protein